MGLGEGHSGKLAQDAIDSTRSLNGNESRGNRWERLLGN